MSDEITGLDPADYRGLVRPAPLEFSIELNESGAERLRFELLPGEYDATACVTRTEGGGLLVVFKVKR